jgi:prevent-host-death family protein
MSNISISDLRNDLSTTVNRVAFSHERIILERQGKAVAVLVPVEDLQLLEELEDAYWAAKAEEDMANHDPADGIPADEFWKGVGLK